MAVAISDAAAQQIGFEVLRRSRRIALGLCLAGAVLFVGGFVGFGIFGNQNQALQRTGTHATAVITGVAPYPEYRYTEHIDVT
jgi:hypothetical protein